ncbi:MAG: ornithine cyclodeaminase [Fuerstiella sp.]|nr:ornithine cyclodeaminase [Fuerstiella sp.]MCP4509515.1 ornithine cyclodeaminase [Fuerstiella sp.]
MDVRIFTRDDVRHLLKMPRAIELMRDAFAALSSGRIESPIRTTLTNDHGTVLYKPTWSAAQNLFCAKVVSVFPGNAHKDLPVTPGIIVLNNGETGMPVALMEAGFLTSLRTGAATGLATDLLAKPDASTAALFGTGGQAGHQLEAMLCVRDLKRVYVFSRHNENAVRFCREMAAHNSNCELIPATNRNVLTECDIITTATTSAKPVFSDREIPTVVHINAIGSLGPNRSEIPAETILRATVVVDHREAGLREAGELLPLMNDGRLPTDFAPAELGELVLNKNYKVERPVTVFKSAGNAVQDLACAAEVLKLAKDAGRGQTVKF